MPDPGIKQAACGNRAGDRLSGRCNKLIAGGLVFILLTFLVFWYQFHLIHAGATTPRLNQFHWGYLILILFFLPIETFALGLRMWIVCRVLQPGVRFWTCFKADLANSGVAILTPFQTGGGLGQIYILNRGGAGLGTAFAVSLLAFVGTMVALLAFGLYALFASNIGHAGALFTGAVIALTLMSAFIIISAAWPCFFRGGIAAASRFVWRILGKRYPLHDWWPPCHSQTGLPADQMDSFCGRAADLLYTCRNDLCRFLQQGKGSFIFVCLLSFAFLVSRSFLAYFCVRFLGIQGATLGEIFKDQIDLIFLTYLAPTPGNAGIAEGTSLWIMESIVPLGFAPYYNLLWRFSTVYVGAAAGLLLLLYTAIMNRPKISPEECSELSSSIHS